ncbi:hypothetical protein NDI37_26585 [Funiculus sociatus GB2-A5]|uniref:Uncharacterized protein n=1 Tax=Funiculus sociatus GB2-A5 TaxID=2933946 RepID=A0ABV0JZI3_9CYAN|nr:MULTISPECIES: hypothetical protein [unclassified Trichocoleus]MBD1908065.1 hypothetical protein [Trichocoleus sp. FACHB-832]MBD2062068.1 hypothetical protein [Trichocoleus sp. FACHB-6]
MNFRFWEVGISGTPMILDKGCGRSSDRFYTNPLESPAGSNLGCCKHDGEPDAAAKIFPGDAW